VRVWLPIAIAATYFGKSAEAIKRSIENGLNEYVWRKKEIGSKDFLDNLLAYDIGVVLSNEKHAALCAEYEQDFEIFKQNEANEQISPQEITATAAELAKTAIAALEDIEEHEVAYQAEEKLKEIVARLQEIAAEAAKTAFGALENIEKQEDYQAEERLKAIMSKLQEATDELQEWAEAA
jgi:hypothetical protein